MRVWAVLGERASHGARRVSLLAGWSDVDGFLTGGTVSATQGIQLPGFSIGTLRTVMVANKKKIAGLGVCFVLQLRQQGSGTVAQPSEVSDFITRDAAERQCRAAQGADV